MYKAGRVNIYSFDKRCSHCDNKIFEFGQSTERLNELEQEVERVEHEVSVEHEDAEMR